MFIFNYLASLLPHKVNNLEPVKNEESDSVIPGAFSEIPDDIISGVFSYLHPKELTKFTRVSKQWQQLTSQNHLWDAFDHKKLFPRSQILDEKVWEKHCDLKELAISLDDASLCDTRTKIVTLARIFAMIQGKIEGDAGVTVLTMPKGLTFNKLVAFAASPKEGNKIGFGYIWDHFLQELGDKPISETHHVVISNALLAGSRNLSFTKQQELVNTIGCKVSEVLHVATLALLTYVSSSKESPVRLFNDDNGKYTYARNLGKVDGCHVAFGGFAPVGPRVIIIFDNDYADVGVAGQWKC